VYPARVNPRLAERWPRRHVDERFVQRFEEAWPIPRTQWTKFHLDGARYRIGRADQRDGFSVAEHFVENDAAAYKP
jgi:hypothetical protein